MPQLCVLAAEELETIARMTSFSLLMFPRLSRRTTLAPVSARISMSGTSQVRASQATCVLKGALDWLYRPAVAGKSEDCTRSGCLRQDCCSSV